MTYQALADAQGVKLDSLRRTIRRKDLSPSERMSADADVPENILSAFGHSSNQNNAQASPPANDPPPAPIVERKPKEKPVRVTPEAVAPIRKPVTRALNGHTVPTVTPPKVSGSHPDDAIEWLFGSAFIRVASVFVLVVLGGVSFCIVSVVRVLSYSPDVSRSVFAVIADTPLAVLVGYGFAGAVVHFTGLLNAYVQSRKATAWNNPAEGWIFGFAIFETVLHATSFGAFGAVGSYWAGVVVMSVALPLSTAALAVVLFVKK